MITKHPMDTIRILFATSVALATNVLYAADPSTDNITGISNDKLRTGDVTFSDIPKAIQSATAFILGFAASIAMIMIIIGALKYSLGSVEGNSPNKQKAQETIKFGIMGFIVSVSSWFIINLVIANI